MKSFGFLCIETNHLGKKLGKISIQNLDGKFPQFQQKFSGRAFKIASYVSRRNFCEKKLRKKEFSSSLFRILSETFWSAFYLSIGTTKGKFILQMLNFEFFWTLGKKLFTGTKKFQQV